MNVKELEMMSGSTVCLAVPFIVVFPTQMTKEVCVCVCVCVCGGGGGGGGGVQKYI